MWTFNTLTAPCWAIIAAFVILIGAAADDPGHRIAPRVMIVSMWLPEEQVWRRRFHETGFGELDAITLAPPGLSMLYPQVLCSQNEFVCHITVGEGEINTAASMMALVLSQDFDLTQSYFLIAGIAGVNPRYATLGSVALARYSVQVALQYEIDPRDLPDDYVTGYIPFGRKRPYQYPYISYGTEVFEVNDRLREIVYNEAILAKLADAEDPQFYRALYQQDSQVYERATQPPRVIKCDCSTSDVYFSGTKLAGVFENTTRIWTNGTGEYCMTAQEDTATLEVLVRAAIHKLVDFGRVIILRSGSNFDRPPPGVSDLEHLTKTNQNGFNVSLENIFNAGIAIVNLIIRDWDCQFEDGVQAENYIGDIWGSLGGQPDFGHGSLTNGEPVLPVDLGGSTKLAQVEIDRRAAFSASDGDEI